MECGPKLLSATSGNRFQTHLKNAANALCARTLPKQRRSETPGNTARHHTYPRATPPKRPAIACCMEPILSDSQQDSKAKENSHPGNIDAAPSSLDKLHHGALAREVAHAWESRVGAPHEPAPAARVQTLFNDIELYPTKTQVFEMLVCARQCARRKSLTLTFGEFCVFAAELRRYSRQARQTATKPDSPLLSADKEIRERDSLCKKINGSEASPPPCEVFLGGSCNPTTWRSDIAIPMLNKMGITYFNPQVEDWSTELMEVEYKAKAEARALLFVLDSETRAVAASVEAAHLAAAPRDLLLVLRPYARHQIIGRETISDHEYLELSRARATLQEAVERRGLPAFTDIPAALRCARAVLRGARTHPRHSLGHTILRLKRAFDAAGGRNARLQRTKAVDTIKEVTRTPREVADKSIPTNLASVDFETFCAAVAELAADPETREGLEGSRRARETSLAERFRSACRYIWQHIAQFNIENHSRTATPDSEVLSEAASRAGDVAPEPRDGNGRVVYNARLKAYGRKLGLFIPKNGGNRTEADNSLSSESSDYVLTPGTSRRLERLPSMLGAPTPQVCLVGRAQPYTTRPEEILRHENLTYVIPRANDYSRMFSAPARRSAPQPESPHRDKKPRSTHDPELRDRSTHDPELRDRSNDSELRDAEEDVQLRDKSAAVDATDRLSASDFYTVSEDSTPQPFKGTYDEDLLLGSRMLVFSMSSDAPCFATMVLAAHYMGLRPNATVLVVQQVDPKLVRAYSEAAIKDYNRGRHYLIDLARRSEVPVFDNVDEAMAYVVKRLKPTS